MKPAALIEKKIKNSNPLTGPLCICYTSTARIAYPRSVPLRLPRISLTATHDHDDPAIAYTTEAHQTTLSGRAEKNVPLPVIM
jgi:hypothetical protein